MLTEFSTCGEKFRAESPRVQSHIAHRGKPSNQQPARSPFHPGSSDYVDRANAPPPDNICRQAGYQGQNTESDVTPACSQENITPAHKGDHARNRIEPHAEGPHDIGTMPPQIIE